MNLLDKVAKALESFALPPRTMPEVNPARAAAAEALAALREAQANPQGFDAWWAQYLGEMGFTEPLQDVRAAYLAGQLSWIPSELRETLIEACIEAEAAHLAASSMWRYRSEHKAQDEADAAKRVAEARKWLEDSCSTQTK